MSISEINKNVLPILTEKGKKAVEDGWNLAICINITKSKVGENLFDEGYAFKLHKRKLVDYMKTLYEMDVHVNTLLHKVIHNLVAVSELHKLGYIEIDNIKKYLPRLSDKFDLVSSGRYSEFLSGLVNCKELKKWYALHYKGYASITPKDLFSNVVTDVKSGCREVNVV